MYYKSLRSQARLHKAPMPIAKDYEGFQSYR